MERINFKPGNILKVTSRSKRGEETRGAIVTHINPETGLVSFAGYRVEGCELETGQGAFWPELVGTKPYGLTVAVEVVGYIKPSKHRHWYPKPGDRHYDLMC